MPPMPVPPPPQLKGNYIIYQLFIWIIIIKLLKILAYGVVPPQMQYDEQQQWGQQQQQQQQMHYQPPPVFQSPTYMAQDPSMTYMNPNPNYYY